MYKYSAFGLDIDSEFELFQLSTRVTNTLKEACSNEQKQADVNIVMGSVPADGIDGSEEDSSFCQALGQDFWLNVESVARFLISHGNTITVDLAEGADLQTMKLYLLGSAMGALLQQRGNLVLHGNAIQIGDGAVIVVAQSGIGKSTLAGEFFRRGYRLLADDVCAIDKDGRVHSSYPYIKLWQEALHKLNIPSQGLTKINAQKDKFYFPLNKQFCRQSLQVQAIYVLNERNVDLVEVKTLKGIEKLHILLKNKYRPFYAKKMDIEHEQILRLTKMILDVGISRINRPKDKFLLEELADAIVCDQTARETGV